MEIGKLTAVFDADTRKFDGPLRTSTAHVHGLETSLTGLRGQLGSVTNALTGFASPLSLATGVVTAYSSAVIGAHVALFELTRSAADFGSKIHDTAQEVGATAETVSTLAYAAKLSGKNLEDITPGIKRFELTIGDAAKGSEKATAALKRLGIDPKQAINDLDGSLAKAFKSIHNAGTGIQQVNLAADAFGKKSGPALISSVETMNGDFNEFQKQARKVGAVLSTDAANAADLFGDTLDQLSTRVKFLGIQFGLELAPEITQAMDIIDRAIAETPRTAQFATLAIKTMIESNVLTPLRTLEQILKGIEQPRSIPINIRLAGPPALIAYFLGQGVGQGIKDKWNPDIMGGQIPVKGFGNLGNLGGRGGGGGPRVDPGVTLLKQLEEAFKNLTPRTELQKVQDKLLEDQYKSTIDTIKKRIMVTAIEIDQMKAAQTDFDKMAELVRSLGEKGEQGFIRARKATDTFFSLDLSKTMTGFQEQMEKLGETIQEMGEKGEKGFTRLKHATDIFLNTRKRLSGFAPEGDRDFIGLGGGSYALRERSQTLNDLLTSTRPRFATNFQQAAHEQIARIQEQMRDLGDNLTSIFTSSIRDGIEQGGAAGLATFGLRLAEVVERNFLEKIANGLGDALGGVATGGGFWGGLLKALGFGALQGLGGVLGGVGLPGTGGAGSGLAGLVGRASGGPVSAMSDYIVGERGPELFRPNVAGAIVPNHKLGPTVVNNYYQTINLPPSPKASYNTPHSKRQLADTVLAALQDAQR